MMTDPTPPPASTDPYVAARQRQLLSAVEKHAQPVDVKLARLHMDLRRIRQHEFASIVDKWLIDVLAEVLDVVEQVAGQVGT